MKRTLLLLGASLFLSFAASSFFTPRETVLGAAAAPEIQTEPLHRFRNPQGRSFYKRGPNLPNGLTGGPWQDVGPVCFVAKTPGSGFRPVYMFGKTNDFGSFYGYSIDQNDPGIQSSGGGGWTNIGVEFYIANTQLPGTVPLYGSSRGAAAKCCPVKVEAGTGTYLLTTDKKLSALKYWTNYGVLGYVWPTEPTPDMKPLEFPDLEVVKTSVQDSGVQATIRNQGKVAISSKPGVEVQFLILERDGTEVFSSFKSLGGMSPGQQTPINFSTVDHKIIGRHYQIRVDYKNKVTESNENNNNTTPAPLASIKIKTDPNSAGKVRVPSIAVTGKHDLPAKGGNPWARYSVLVYNWSDYPDAWFQSTKGQLPPGPCGDARMQATFLVSRSGSVPGKVGCKALNSPQDFQSLEVETKTLADTDKIVITLLDRLTKEYYQSEPFTVGWQGPAELLVPLGCKYFLGRASHYLCTTDKGFNACENLRQSGKPIKCSRTGK